MMSNQLTITLPDGDFLNPKFSPCEKTLDWLENLFNALEPLAKLKLSIGDNFAFLIFIKSGGDGSSTVHFEPFNRECGENPCISNHPQRGWPVCEITPRIFDSAHNESEDAGYLKLYSKDFLDKEATEIKEVFSKVSEHIKEHVLPLDFDVKNFEETLNTFLNAL